MTDDLIARLRCYPANRLCRQVADALEAKDARIAELEAEIDDAHEVLSMCDIPFHDDDGVEYSLPQRLKTRVKEQRAARAALGEKE